MVKSLNIAAQNVTLAAAGAVGRDGTPVDFSEMGLSDLLNVELRPSSYGDLGLQELLNVRLDGSGIPGIGGMGFDPVLLASADLPDDLTQLSLRELMNLGVSQHAIIQDAVPDLDLGDVTVSGPNAANRDHQSDSPGNLAQGGGSSFAVADLGVLVENPAPEDIPPLELEDEDDEQGVEVSNFGALVSSDEDVAAEVITDLLDGDGDGDDEDAGNTTVGTNENDLLLGDGTDGSLHGKDGDDYLDGGGGRDKLWGGNGDDVLRWDPSDLLISGGNGTDTLLILTGEVEFDDFHGHISGIEQIDLASDPGANELELNVQDVLDLSDSDILTVFGDSADSVDAGTGWADAGLDGEGYHLYTQMVGGQLATLRVDDDISLNTDILI